MGSLLPATVGDSGHWTVIQLWVSDRLRLSLVCVSILSSFARVTSESSFVSSEPVGTLITLTGQGPAWKKYTLWPEKGGNMKKLRRNQRRLGKEGRLCGS